MLQRVYKFMRAEHARSSMRTMRLKLSTLADLNDPFDFFNAVDTTNPIIANAVMQLRSHMSPRIGILCFSRNWDNLLMWSHYANSHRGVCLGFDVADESSICLDVRYQPNLLRIRSEKDVNEDLAFRLLCTKHESWSYEQEIRAFVPLNDPADENGRHWIDFGPALLLRLREVIVGAECSPEDADTVCELLKGYPDQIECTWAYMRSNAFLLEARSTPHASVFRPSERAIEKGEK